MLWLIVALWPYEVNENSEKNDVNLAPVLEYYNRQRLLYCAACDIKVTMA